MGGEAAIHKWKSRNVRRVVRWRDADACGDSQTTAPCWNLPDSDSSELSRRLDVPRRCLRTMVQRELVIGPCREYGGTAVQFVFGVDGWRKDTSARRLSNYEG